MVVDIGLDVGVNVGQGTSTCGRPIREQKNTRCKWEVRSREPFSPSPPHLPLFHNTISPEEFRGNARLENLGRDSLQRSFSPREHLDYKTKSLSPFWEEEEGSIIRLDGGGGTMQFDGFATIVDALVSRTGYYYRALRIYLRNLLIIAFD